MRTIAERPAPAAPPRTDRRAQIFVWSALAAQLVIALVHIARDGHDIPLAEDWNLVPALTGQQDDVPAWLWEQNNEHRLPLPKLLLLGLLEVSGGDFRSGMVFNTLALAAMAAAMVLVARFLRSRTSYADAFFPVALLHLGHWENLVWSWQIQFVVSSLLVCVVLLVVVGHRGALSTRAAATGAVCLVLLPLSGASGLVFLPFAAAALAILVTSRPRVGRPARLVVLGGAVAALAISGAYFVGYEEASWNPDNPGLVPTTETSAKFLALAAGPAAEWSWPLFTLAAIAVVVATVAVLVPPVLRRGDHERVNALAAGALVLGMGALAGAVGWGRAGSVPMVGLPDRYAILAVPIICSAYLVWVRFGPPRVAPWAQAGLFGLMIVALPLNTRAGYDWRAWYSTGMDAVERDISAGTSRDEIVTRHGDFLLHWDDEKLRRGIDLLRGHHVGPFGDQG